MINSMQLNAVNQKTNDESQMRHNTAYNISMHVMNASWNLHNDNALAWQKNVCVMKCVGAIVQPLAVNSTISSEFNH